MHIYIAHMHTYIHIQYHVKEREFQTHLLGNNIPLRRQVCEEIRKCKEEIAVKLFWGNRKIKMQNVHNDEPNSFEWKFENLICEKSNYSQVHIIRKTYGNIVLGMKSDGFQYL